MKNIKTYLITIGITLLSLLILSLITTVFSYYDILNYSIIKILKVLTPIISIFISNIYLGIKTDKKAYLEGLKIGIIYIILLILIKSIIFNNFKLIDIITYIIILIISSISSIIGINLKQKIKHQ